MKFSNELPPLPHGLWGILATPFEGTNFEIDGDSLTRLVKHFEIIGAEGVVALGVFGEGASLNSYEQKSVIEKVCESTSKMQVIVGISERATATGIEQSLRARDVAGDRLAGLMIQVNTSNSESLIEHLTKIHEATQVGIVLQDYPVVSGVKISPSQILATLERCPFIIAVKSESPPTAQVIAELSSKTKTTIIGGLGGVGLIDELEAGATGVMTGFSYPEALIETIRAYSQNGFEGARNVFAKWLPLANFEAQPGIGLAIRKRIYQERGIFKESSVRPPTPTMPKILEPIMHKHLLIVEEYIKNSTGCI
jgi:4-hydroxy-tetrahydrodipicolinate synthase